MAYGVQAQSTDPRYVAFGTTDASSIGFARKTITDVASATLDTVKFYPRTMELNLNLTVLDSCTLTYGSLAGVYFNDHVFLYVTNPAQTGVLKLLGNFIVSTGTNTLSLTANKHCVLEFWFDGAKYIEVSRNLNY